MSLTNAAGTAKTVDSALAVWPWSDAVVLGSFTMRERSGNPGIVDFFDPTKSVNVRGIPSPALLDWQRIVREVVAVAQGQRVVVSVAAFDPAEYGYLATAAFDAGADAVELNFGCPNMQEAGGFAPVMSYRPHMVAQALDAVGRQDGEVWAKVSPIFDDEVFDGLVRALRHPVVAGVVAVNTLPQCLVLDAQHTPVLSFGSGVGGMAGPVLKPVALAQAARYVREGFRVIGVGGIVSGGDLLDFLSVGAESGQVNTVVQIEGPSAIGRILKEAVVSA